MNSNTFAPITRKKTIKHVVNGYGLKCAKSIFGEFERQASSLLNDICRTHLVNAGGMPHKLSTTARQQSLELKGSSAAERIPPSRQRPIPKHGAAADALSLHEGTQHHA